MPPRLHHPTSQNMSIPLDRPNYSIRCAVIRCTHSAIHTEEAPWAKRFILSHRTAQGKFRHPQEMGAAEIEAFLTHMAVYRQVAASTHNQPLGALRFLYRHVLKHAIGLHGNVLRAKKPKRLPAVLSRDEVRRILSVMTGAHQLIARLLYGSDLRLMVCVRLRVRDIDFAQRLIVVRNGKGEHDRITMPPDALIPFLRDHLTRVYLMPERSVPRLRPRLLARRAVRNVPQRRSHTGMAVCLSRRQARHRSPLRYRSASPRR